MRGVFGRLVGFQVQGAGNVCAGWMGEVVLMSVKVWEWRKNND